MSRFTNKKSCNLFFLLVAMMFSLHGKGQDFIWASQTTQQAYGYSRIRLIITDSQGNIYSTGSFGGTVNFDPSLNNFILFQHLHQQILQIVISSKCHVMANHAFMNKTHEASLTCLL